MWAKQFASKPDCYDYTDSLLTEIGTNEFAVSIGGSELSQTISFDALPILTKE